MKQTLLLFAGAAVGGALGYFAFFWVLRQGFYGLILPGGLLGLGAGFAKIRSIWPAIACGLAAIALGLFTEWRYEPFVKDDSLGYFLQHVHELKPVTLLMILVGGVVGFWIPFGRMESKRG
jgi:hypothetical protein